MVFDCGSKTAGAGQEEVRIYRDTDFLNENVLDFLVISHFDSDHVNHINRLLDGGVKVKRLVMPFLTFEERLYLTLKVLEENDGYNEDLDYTTRLILDPLTTLSENLDDDSEAYFIESDPGEPISPADNNEGIEIENNDNGRSVFTFPKKAKKEKLGKLKGKVFKVIDTSKGCAADSQSRMLLMDFLFYKKSIGSNEEEFFKNVKEIFFDKQKIDNKLNDENLLEAIVEKIKLIPSATKIREIFEEAAIKTGIIKDKVKNLNNTALCMLHRNQRQITDYLAEEKFSIEDFYKSCTPGFYHIQKFLAGKQSRIIKACDLSFFMYYDDYHIWRYKSRDNEATNFPNVLLTSDCYLLERDDVEAFLDKYKYYLTDIWLFQIPHHGSKENSDAVLHSNIPYYCKCFINYGTGNTHKHPSNEVIESLVANGLSTKLISVNEFQGFEFTFNLQVCKRES